MTISSTARKAGPFNGNDSTTTFPFAFKVFSTADVVVVHTDAGGTESTLVLGTDYTVSLNADQDVSPGGNVVKTTALATGTKLTITSDVENLQPVDLTNQGGFYPRVIGTALDRLTIMVQQLAEQVSRSVKVGISSISTPDELMAELAGYVTSALGYSNSASSAASAAASSQSSAAASAVAAAASAAAAAVAGLPVGSTIYVPSTTAPPGTIKKNGALLLRADFPNLWAFAQASGNMAASDGAWTVGQFSPGNGSTTFRIPDGRAEIIRGWDDGRGVDSGRALGSWQDGDNKTHTHGVTDPGHSHVLTHNAGPAGATFQSDIVNQQVASNSGPVARATNSVSTGISIQSSGGSETRMRNVAELACIKY